MNLTETAKLLAFISELDYRRFTEETAVAWHEVLGKYDYQDCRDAVIAHNTSSGEFLKPGHIGKIIHANRKRRLSGVPVTLVANVDDRRGIESTAEDHDHYKRVRAEIREAIANGSSPPPSTSGTGRMTLRGTSSRRTTSGRVNPCGRSRHELA